MDLHLNMQNRREHMTLYLFGITLLIIGGGSLNSTTNITLSLLIIVAGCTMIFSQFLREQIKKC